MCEVDGIRILSEVKVRNEKKSVQNLQILIGCYMSISWMKNLETPNNVWTQNTYNSVMEPIKLKNFNTITGAETNLYTFFYL